MDKPKETKITQQIIQQCKVEREDEKNCVRSPGAFTGLF